MKYIASVIFLFVIVAFITGCKKTTCLYEPSSIVGKWELRQLSGQIGIKNFARGNGSVYTFTDSTYSIAEKGTVLKTGNFQIIADSTVEAEIGLVIEPGKFKNRIVFDNDTLTNKTFFQISNHQLELISGYFPLDGGVQYTYERQ